MPTPSVSQLCRGALAALSATLFAVAQGSCAPPGEAQAAEAEALPVGAAGVGLAGAAAPAPPSSGEPGVWAPAVPRRPASPLEGVLALPPGTLPPAELAPIGDLGEAVRLLKRGDPAGARRELSAYDAQARGGVDAVFGTWVRAHIELAEGSPARAAASFASIRNGDVGLRSEIALWEGRALLDAGEPLQAARRIQAAAEAVPEGSFRDARLVEAADAFLAAGHPVTASKLYEDVLTRTSGGEKESVTLKLAQAQLRRGMRTEALSALDELSTTAESCAVNGEATQLLIASGALSPERDAPGPALRRVERMTACDRFDDAATWLKATADRADADSLEEGWLRLWYARWDMEQLDHYTRARLAEELDDLSRSRLSRWAAKTAFRLGDAERAGDLRMASASLGDREPSTNDRFAAGLLYAEAHAWAKARPLLEAVLAERPSRQTRIESMWYLAWAALMDGRHAEAERRLTALTDRYDDEDRGRAAMYWLGRLALSQGQPDQALAWFRQVKEASADSFYTFLISSLHLDEAATPAVALAPGILQVESALKDAPIPGERAGVKVAALPPATHASILTLPANAPWRTLMPTLPDISATPFLDLPSPLRPTPPVDIHSWEEEGRVALNGLASAYGDLSPELRIAHSLARAGFRHQAGPWLDEARDQAKASTNVKLKRLSWERVALHQAFWYLDQPLDALRSDPTGYPFPTFDLTRPETVDVWKRRYPRVYAEEVARGNQSWGVDPSLIYGIMRTESMFGSDQVSSVGARGLMQIMPATGSKIADLLGEPFKPDDLFDTGRNVWYGSWYLAQLLDRFGGQLPLAVAAYNAGPRYVGVWAKRLGEAPVDVFIEEIPLRQTRGYVKKVLRAMALYRGLYARSEPLPLRALVDPTSRPGVDF